MALSSEPRVRRHSYAALRGPEHIRLITLHPALFNDSPLRINFSSSNLKDHEGRYEAISYTWGQPILKFALHVDDGTQVFVTENLDRALRYLRRTDRDRLLWADAVSINQADNEEKALQIPLMVQIFRGARSVMAWLDPGGDTTVEQKGMRELDRLSRVSVFTTGYLTESLSEILRFFNLPWFNRLWIIQEIVFSLDIYLICGNMELSFSRLLVALSALDVEIEDYLCDAADEARMQAILKITKLWNRHSFLDQQPKELPVDDTTQILSLVENFCSYGCTDPRDRIFALYSMATDVRSTSNSYWSGSRAFPPPPQISFYIDYSLDVREIYQTFARSCWEQGAGHRKLWEALLSRQYSFPQTNWSSWAPDWRILPRPIWPKNSDHLEYPHIEVPECATSILRMRFSYRGSTEDDGIGNLYTIHLKTSRTAQNNQTPLLSQIKQIHTSLQNRRRFLGRPSMLPEQLRSRLPMNIVFDMINALLPYHGQPESMSLLEAYLGTMNSAPEEPDSVFNAVSSNLHVEDLIYCLDLELGDNELFCCLDPLSQVYSVGFGTKRLEPGDKIILLDDQTEHVTWDTFTRVLIIRQANYVDDTLEPTFLLIGSGYLLDYTWFYLNVMRSWERDRKIHTDDSAWDQFHRNFNQQDNYGVLNLV